MGAQQSARKVDVIQDEATGVIKISDSVVQRLKGEITGENQQQEPKQQQSPPPPQPEPTPPPAPPVVETPPPPPAPTPSEPAPLAPGPNQVWQRPIIQYIEEPSISALRVKAEKEEEMKNLDDYWKDRLQKQEESFMTAAKLSEEEILKGAKYVDTLFKPAANKQFCRESQLQVQSCYESNPTKPLLCREKVLEFTNCVATMVSPGA